MEETLQHATTAQRSGLPPTGTLNPRRNGPEAGNALTIKLDHSGGADQNRKTALLVSSRFLLTRPHLEFRKSFFDANRKLGAIIFVSPASRSGASARKRIIDEEVGSGLWTETTKK